MAGKHLRIAMLSYHTCPLAILGGKDTGGMNVYVRDLTRHLAEMGIQVDVFTRSQDEHVPHVVHSLGYGSRVVHVPAGPEIPLSKKLLAEHIPQFVEYILDFAKRRNFKYDLIHSHYWMSGIGGKHLKAAWGVPMVHMFHTLGLMKNRIAGEGEYEGDYRIRGELEVLRSADKIVAATPAELAQLQWLYEVKTTHVEVIPLGVNLRRFYPIPKADAKEFLGQNAQEKMILFVGRIEPLKGIDTLLKACVQLKEMGLFERNNICVSIIGGDAAESEEELSHEMARLQRMSRDLGLDEVVSFLGKRSQEVLPYYYSAAEVVVVPSHYESFGMVALEAMACGIPVVASQVGGLNYLVQDGETGYHVPDRDEKALSLRLVKLLEDEEEHKRMGENAAEFAKNYNWEIIAGQIIQLYQQVAQPHK